MKPENQFVLFLKKIGLLLKKIGLRLKEFGRLLKKYILLLRDFLVQRKHSFLPPLMGIVTASVSVILCLLILACADRLFPNAPAYSFVDKSSFALPLLLTVSTFFLYAVMLLCRKWQAFLLRDDPENKNDARGFARFFRGWPAFVRRDDPRSGSAVKGFTPLFILGAAAVSAAVLLLEHAAGQKGGNVLLTMVAFIIPCNVLVTVSFVGLICFVRWMLRLMEKTGDRLRTLRWLLPLSLLWFAVIFAALMI